MQWQEGKGRTILNDALKTVEETTKQVGPIDVSGELMTGHAGSDACRPVHGRRDGRGGLPWPRCDGPAAGVGQHRAGPPRALPGCGHQ